MLSRRIVNHNYAISPLLRLANLLTTLRGNINLTCIYTLDVRTRAKVFIVQLEYNETERNGRTTGVGTTRLESGFPKGLILLSDSNVWDL